MPRNSAIEIIFKTVVENEQTSSVGGRSDEQHVKNNTKRRTEIVSTRVNTQRRGKNAKKNRFPSHENDELQHTYYNGVVNVVASCFDDEIQNSRGYRNMII